MSAKKTKRKTKQQEIDELKNTLQFVQAEFENYKKRQDRDHEARIKLSAADIIIKILPIIDDFEHALCNAYDNQHTLEGFQMIYNNLMTLLKKEGLEEINPHGEKFDPYLHEAVQKDKSDKESMTILAVLQKGYKLNGRVIRHAKVKVAQ